MKMKGNETKVKIEKVENVEFHSYSVSLGINLCRL